MDISDMHLEQKIGQMVMAGFPSDSIDKNARSIIEDAKIGNIILFARNVKDAKSLADLNMHIQQMVISSTGIPAFISIDQEGGMVTRIQKGATFFPGNMAFSAAGDECDTETEGRIEGEELRAMGININIAPVLDINSNPENPVIGVRSYGDDPDRVARLGMGYIKGIQGSGVIATAKHFPGHGDTSTDSHLCLPSVPYDMERLRNVELYPFRKAIESGVDAIMSAHVLFPAIENERLPATLSYKILTGLLRKRMGFNGIIMTDCMEMKAIADYFGTVNAAVMAVKAGADIVCVSHSMNLQVESVNAIKKAVIDGEIQESRIDESVNRILAIKRKYRLFNNPYPDTYGVKNFVGSKGNKEFAESMSEKSITLFRNDDCILPVKPGRIVSISTEPLSLTGADNVTPGKSKLSEALRNILGGKAYTIPLDPDGGLIEKMVNICKPADTVIAGTYNASLNHGQAMLINKIYEANKKLIVVSLRNPYDILMFKRIPVYICAYEYTPLSISSVLKVITGEIKAVGKLPIKLELH